MRPLGKIFHEIKPEGCILGQKSTLQVWFHEKFSPRASSWGSEYVNLHKILLPTVPRNLTQYFFQGSPILTHISARLQGFFKFWVQIFAILTIKSIPTTFCYEKYRVFSHFKVGIILHWSNWPKWLHTVCSPKITKIKRGIQYSITNSQMHPLSTKKISHLSMVTPCSNSIR